VGNSAGHICVALIGGNDFGCMILRNSVLDEFLVHDGGNGDYDPTLYRELMATRYRAKLDWSCVRAYRMSIRGRPAGEKVSPAT